MKICNIEDCNNNHYAFGLCKKHYDSSPERKIYYEKYNNSLEGKASRKKYSQTEKGKEKRKEIKKIYNQSEKGKETEKNYKKDHPEVSLKAHIKYLEKLGKSFDMNSIEIQYALQSWSKTIRKLDNHMCKNCDSTENLNSHHIQPKAEFPELSLDLDNGITLCLDCHSEVHGFKIY